MYNPTGRHIRSMTRFLMLISMTAKIREERDYLRKHFHLIEWLGKIIHFTWFVDFNCRGNGVSWFLHE